MGSTEEQDLRRSDRELAGQSRIPLTKFEVYGQELVEKVVKQSGNSGRVYLPPDWVGKHTKIIRVD